MKSFETFYNVCIAVIASGSFSIDLLSNEANREQSQFSTT